MRAEHAHARRRDTGAQLWCPGDALVRHKALMGKRERVNALSCRPLSCTFSSMYKSCRGQTISARLPSVGLSEFSAAVMARSESHPS